MPRDLTYPKKSHRTPARDGDKLQARGSVHYAVRVGRLPRPSTLLCTDCGGAATGYDHHLGYGAAHHLDVQPVCQRCNVQRGLARGENFGPPRGTYSVPAYVNCGGITPPYRHGRCNRCRTYWLRHHSERPSRYWG